MMNYTIKLLIIIILSVTSTSCRESWEEYYSDIPETVDQNIWDVLKSMPEISTFVGLLEEYQFDTLFNNDVAYTLFIPGNDIIEAYMATDSVTGYLLGYHIVSHIIQSGSAGSKERLVQTLSKKYLRVNRDQGIFRVNDIPVIESPLYLDGKYFILESVLEPLPNLYEFFKNTNPALSNYIDEQDSVVLDRELSTPIGFDEFGRTVYDSVSDIVNKFELNYFPVKQEDRNYTATIVFPSNEQYKQALNKVADALGPSVFDYNDVPIKWQYDVLFPFLFKRVIFRNLIEPEEFEMRSSKEYTKLLNVLGDSVLIDYVPGAKTVCSNGYAYEYSNFEIPEKLYLGPVRFEMEELVEETGINTYSWEENIVVKTDISVVPKELYIAGSSNDSVVVVTFPKGYSGTYQISFKGPEVFPRNYQMIIRTNMDVGGILDIYVNDKLAGTFDYNEYRVFRGVIYSQVTGKRFLPDGRYNSFDVFVDNVTEYKAVDIRIEYKGPSTAQTNGILIDYIEFVPAP